MASFRQDLRRGGFRLSPGASGSGFNLSIDRRDFDGRTRAQLEQDALIISGAGVDAVVRTTRSVKMKIRNYITANFRNSAMHGNNQRRVANASAQDRFYDDRQAKGQYTGLVYSKFGKRDRGGFMDFLSLHMRGGTIRARYGDWMMVRNPRATGLGMDMARMTRAQGVRSLFGQRVFMRPSPDGSKLFLLREKGTARSRSGRQRAGGSARDGLELLATLTKQVEIPARLGGILDIVRMGGVEMEGRIGQLLDERLQANKGTA